jgi:aconitate hydratase
VITDEKVLSPGAYVFFPGIKKSLKENADTVTGYVLAPAGPIKITAALGPLTGPERQILLDGCLINHYK